jgi:LysM repeat protein
MAARAIFNIVKAGLKGRKKKWHGESDAPTRGRRKPKSGEGEDPLQAKGYREAEKARKAAARKRKKAAQKKKKQPSKYSEGTDKFIDDPTVGSAARRRRRRLRLNKKKVGAAALTAAGLAAVAPKPTSKKKSTSDKTTTKPRGKDVNTTMYGMNKGKAKKADRVVVPKSDPKPTTPAKKKTYVVKSGDTLSEIAQKTGTTLKKLKEANPQIKNINKIFAGQKIKVPGRTEIYRKSVYQGMKKSELKRKRGGVVKRNTGGMIGVGAALRGYGKGYKTDAF